MAIVKNSVILDTLTGSLGPFVIKNFRGKKVLGIKPQKYNKSNSAKAVKGRSNFAAAVSLAKIINSQAELKKIWAQAEIYASSPYQKMVSINSKRAANGMLTLSNKITPDGIPAKITSALFENDTLKLSFNFPSFSSILFPVKIFVFLGFNKNQKIVYKFNFQIEEQAPDGTYNGDITMDQTVLESLQSEPDPFVYLAAVGSTEYKKKKYWTDTASFRI